MVSKMSWEIGWSLSKALKSLIAIWRALFAKAYNVSARKLQRIYVSWHWKVMQNLKENWEMACKMTGIWLIFMRAVESLKVCTLMGSFSPKYIEIYMKKNRRVMYHDTEEWCKIRRRTNPYFQKMTWRIWWIFNQPLDSLKIPLWRALFVQST